MTFYKYDDIMSNNAVLAYCEKYGICAVHSRRGNTLTYYSYFGSEGFYKVVINVKTGHETRTNMHWHKAPKFIGDNYNYFCG